MSAIWKQWLLSSGLALVVGCGASDHDGVGGDPSTAADGSVRDGSTSTSMDGSVRRDASVRRDGSTTLPSGDGGDEDENCGALMAKIRDFTPDHPDFEHYSGSGTTGIVANMLDADHLPVLASAQGQVTSKESFDQWYRNTSGVNQEIDVELTLTDKGNGRYEYSSNAFFPIDGKGFGNNPNFAHNFNFTTQIATSFTYHGGEVFMFTGDDDLWIFVNDRLALDLGGLHASLSKTIDFDAKASELGIVKGETYRMDIFHAERHTNQSNFTISTTISCFKPPIAI